MARIRAASLVLIVVVLLGACTTLPQAANDAAKITIVDPFARSSPMEGGTGGAFMKITNAGPAADRLASAAFAGAQTVELHETVDDNGVMKMRPHPEGWEVPGRGELVLEPGGKHVMLIGLKDELKADTEIELTLTFEKAGPITVKVPVKGP